MSVHHKQELELIRANSDLSPQAIVDILSEHGYVLTETSVRQYLSKLNRMQENCKDVATTIVDATIEEFVARNATKYLNMLDENIEQIVRILNDSDSEVSLRDASGQIDRRMWGKYSKLLGEQVRTTLSIRPVEPTGSNTRTNINVNVDMPLDDLLEKYYHEYKVEKATRINNTKEDKDDIQFVEEK